MRTVLEYLERAAARYPDKIAVIDENGSCTYEELLGQSRRIGSALEGQVKRRAPVAVLMEKSIDTLSVFFGIQYAGGFYVLLNPELPEARLAQVQSVLQAEAVICDENTYELANVLFPAEAIWRIEACKNQEIAYERLAGIRRTALDTDPLYANFTSGSTGTPKGVLVSNRSVLDFIGVFTDCFDISSEDVIGNQAPFDFDVSVKDIYSAMKTGATLVLIPRQLFSNPVGLLDFICCHEITTMIWAVSALCLITAFHGLEYKTPQTVNKVLFSGEVMPLKHLRSWMEHLPRARFVNLYGPTEITCNCTYHIIDRARDYERGIPIGQAFPNEEVFLLDDGDQVILEPETAGEICVRGTALALGYYRAPEQTAAAFVQNPLNNCYPEPIYRTGDLGVYDETGDLFFSGRKDFQVKHMGHRIELEEIERAIHNTPGVERCCCIFDEKKSKLYGFYIGALDKKELYTALKEKLPVFMIPGALRRKENLPVTANGKIDRKALLEEVRRK